MGYQGTKFNTSSPRYEAAQQFDTYSAIVVTDAERLTVIYPEGLLIWTSDTHKLYVGDGVTYGGVPVTSVLSDNAVILDFDFNDLPAGNKFVRKIPTDKLLERVDLIIYTEFSSSVTITVGDSSDTSRHLKVNENMPKKSNTYEKSLNYKYDIDTNVYMYFTGTSISGKGRLIIYFA